MLLKEMPVQFRPREKLLEKGVQTLTNSELLAVILGKGKKQKDVLMLASEVVSFLDECSDEPSLDSLAKIGGIGNAKACQIMASLELSKRFLRSPQRLKIKSPMDAIPGLLELKGSPQELFAVMTLDGGNQLIKTHIVTKGLVNQTQIHPREAFLPAIEDRAVSVLVAHNHPSGALQPSESDLSTTKRLWESSKTLGIPLLDHLIVSRQGYFSIKQHYPGCFT